VNFVRPADPVVIGVNGVFGERMCDVAARCGAEVVRVEAPWGQPVDPEALLGAHPSPAVIAVVHAETSTGVRSDIEPLGDGKGDALLLVDCVTSLGGIPVEIDGWGVDIAYSGTQKCLGCPPGLSPMTVSERAQARLVERPQSWYLDLNMIAKYVTGAGARAYHHTAPISMVFAIHAALGALLDEGLEKAFARHASCGEELHQGLADLGLELFAAPGYRLPELTTVWVPEAIRSEESLLRRELLDRYGVEIGGGLGAYTGKLWRIGLMGHTARPRNVTLLLRALEELLDR
jgi:alanine-glyoxylate transaminase/serine-glyoxylate transaminase/serine-pyruvate transaminase